MRAHAWAGGFCTPIAVAASIVAGDYGSEQAIADGGRVGSATPEDLPSVGLCPRS